MGDNACQYYSGYYITRNIAFYIPWYSYPIQHSYLDYSGVCKYYINWGGVGVTETTINPLDYLIPHIN